MKALSIITGLLLGIFAGVAAGFLLASYGSHHDDEEAGYEIMAWLVVMGGIGAVAGGVLAARLHRDLTGMHFTRTSARVKAGILFAIVAGIPLLTIGALHSPLNKFNPPSDREMLGEFHRIKPALEQVLAISKEYKADDPAEADHYDPTKISDIPDYRFDQSWEALNQVGLPGGCQIDKKSESIAFDYWESAPVLDIEGDAAKGYAYFATPPQNVQRSLDRYALSGKTKVIAYRHIEGNWYLYFQYQPISAS